MTAVLFNAANARKIEWDEAYFKFCEFEGISIDGGTISSDFVTCRFTNLDWYWGLFTASNFIHCEFKECRFAGTAFPDTLFVACRIIDCVFVKDNLGSDCDFSRTSVYGCVVENSPDFNKQIVVNQEGENHGEGKI